MTKRPVVKPLKVCGEIAKLVEMEDQKACKVWERIESAVDAMKAKALSLPPCNATEVVACLRAYEELTSAVSELKYLAPRWRVNFEAFPPKDMSWFDGRLGVGTLGDLVYKAAREVHAALVSAGVKVSLPTSIEDWENIKARGG